MRSGYLDITFRKGKALAAYYHLPREADDRSARTEPAAPGPLVNYAQDGRPIGLEITSPATVQLADLI